jgi:S1-C subfamily serine protease
MQAAPQLPFTEIRAERDEKTGQRRISGVSVRFGSIPEYGWEGEGLLLGGTSENSPAERAGLLRGDIISQVGDIEVLNIYDFMFALQTYKAGDVVLVRFQRDDTEQSVRLTLEAKALE